QTNAPGNLSNVVAVAAGGYHSLALTRFSAAPQFIGYRRFVVTEDYFFQHRFVAGNGAIVYGAVGLPPGLSMDPTTGWVTGTPRQSGSFQVTLFATNAVGVGSFDVVLYVNLPSVPVIPTSRLVSLPLNLDLRYPIATYNAPTWFGASGLPP